MAGTTLTLIYYYIPEDKDDIDMPNAFGIKKKLEDIRLNDIKIQFPIEGQYHFRFKYKHGSEYVWLDIVNTDCKLPSVEGKIIMKATRKTWEKNLNTSNIMQNSNPKEIIRPKGKLLEGLDSPATVPNETSPVDPMTLNNGRKEEKHDAESLKQAKTDEYDVLFGFK